MVARRRSGRLTIGILAAAALVAAWVVAPDAALRWRADAVTGTGETRALALADGSMVRLAPGSAVMLDERNAERRVRLVRGTAWFDIVHDRHRPFQVMTGGITTTVLGTAFEVRRDSGPSAAVAVKRGAVRVACDGQTGDARRVSAGQRLDLTCGGHASLVDMPPERIAPWIDGQFIAADASLRTVIDAIRPWYRGMIVARGERIDRVHVTGVYDLRNPAAALAALAATGHARTHRITPWVTIVSPTDRSQAFKK